MNPCHRINLVKVDCHSNREHEENEENLGSDEEKLSLI